MAVRLALALTLAGAAFAYPFGLAAVHGITLGSLTGILAFWLFAYSVERAVSKGKDLDGLVMSWAYVRMGFYAAALIRGYFLDKEQFTGLFAAMAGLFVIRLAVMILAFTGLDLKPQEK
jgi:hypothetical protein